MSRSDGWHGGNWSGKPSDGEVYIPMDKAERSIPPIDKVYPKPLPKMTDQASFITLRFVDGTDWVSKIIHSGEMGFRASHVECKTPWNTLLGAHIEGGIEDRPLDYDTSGAPSILVTIPCTKAQADAFHAFLRTMVGNPYDFEAIGMMVGGVVTSSAPPLGLDTSAICSWLMMSGLSLVGVFGPSPAGRLTTPRDLLQMCAALKCTIPEWPEAPVAKSKLKVVTHTVTLERYVMGRKAPIAKCPRLKLGNYLYKGLPKPPALITFRKIAQPTLRDPYLNDELGDCVIAGMAHLLARILASAGYSPVRFSREQIIELYTAIGGYNPGDQSTDRGCDEETALNYWVQNGIWFPKSGNNNSDPHKAEGWIAINGADPDEVRTALWLFENLLFGVSLPNAWLSPMPNDGFTWSVAGQPNPENGHCFVGISARPGYIGIDTWGREGWVSDAAVAEYTSSRSGGQLYAVLTKDIINKAKGKAANGFDWSQLTADLESMKAA